MSIAICHQCNTPTDTDSDAEFYEANDTGCEGTCSKCRDDNWKKAQIEASPFHNDPPRKREYQLALLDSGMSEKDFY